MSTLVTFCEGKYEISNYIYEFYNTISNFTFFYYAHMGYNKNKNNKKYLTLIPIGIGSSLLHGFGNYFGQLIDEISMLVYVIVMLNSYKVNISRLTLFNVLGLFSYFYFKIYSIFLFLFSSQAIYLSYIIYINTKPFSNERVLAIKTNLLFITGKIIWELEQNFCDKLNFFKWFHPVWHFISSYCAYSIVILNEIYKKKLIKMESISLEEEDNNSWSVYNTDNFPIVNVKLEGNINSQEDFDSFTNMWLQMYEKEEPFTFVFDATKVGYVNVKYAMQMGNFIKDLKRNHDNSFLKRSIIIVDSFWVNTLLKMIFLIESPVAPVYVYNVRKNINITELLSDIENNNKLNKNVSVYKPKLKKR